MTDLVLVGYPVYVEEEEFGFKVRASGRYTGDKEIVSSPKGIFFLDANGTTRLFTTCFQRVKIAARIFQCRIKIAIFTSTFCSVLRRIEFKRARIWLLALSSATGCAFLVISSDR